MPASAANALHPVPAKAGIGLRFQHHQAVLETAPGVAWMEVHTENYMGGGTPLRYLDAIRHDYPIALHGVGLSLGGAEGLDAAHLERIRSVAERIEPALMSEHVAWSVADGNYLADLLPLPMTEEALVVVCRHVDQVQSVLKRRILVENPSTYLRFRHSAVPEWEFMAAVAARTGCGLLCDVNNIYVSAHNHGWDASAYLAALPPAAIGEIHLAGHSVRALPGGGTLRIDDHGSHVSAEVWVLYLEALTRFGAVPTLIEWDNDVPPLDILLAEACHADALLARRTALPGTADVPPASPPPCPSPQAGKDGVAAGLTPAVPGRVHPGERRAMPALLELQHAVHDAMVDRDDGAAVAMLAGDVPADRLDIYRNTFIAGVTKVLRLSFPAVHRLVGNDFFDGAASLFIAQHPPRAAWLDAYGAAFPRFLQDFPPATSLEYLGDVARLEWAVSRALHAPDVAPLDLARLQALRPEDQARVCFAPHPSVSLLCAGHPADAIWRGVLDGDDAALTAIDLMSGPVCLLVERRATGTEVSRLDPAAWRFAAALCEGRPLADVFAACPQPAGDSGHDVMLAGHLAAGRFVDFHLDQSTPCVTAPAPSPECLP
jgi:uncharacterized protein (UPF0276 family)